MKKNWTILLMGMVMAIGAEAVAVARVEPDEPLPLREPFDDVDEHDVALVEELAQVPVRSDRHDRLRSRLMGEEERDVLAGPGGSDRYGRQPQRVHPCAAGRAPVTTWTFHRPLQTYVRAFSDAGFLIESIEEWPSLRQSQPGPRAREENRARKEIPLFLGKFPDDFLDWNRWLFIPQIARGLRAGDNGHY